MPLLKDLINIPERVHQGDFVLKLSEGVTHAEQTLRDYVVTPQLMDAFGNALGFIQQAVQTADSKAAFLHGSFGSGKSLENAATVIARLHRGQKRLVFCDSRSSAEQLSSMRCVGAKFEPS